jgi:hypothetical protein
MKQGVRSVPIQPPYSLLAKHEGECDHVGINWSYAQFKTAVQRDAFAKECNGNGYRTRNAGIDHDATVFPFYVQYHHHAD